MGDIKLNGKDKVVAVILGLIGLAIFTVIGVMVMPLILAALINTTYVLGMLVALAITASVIWDTRMTILYAYKNYARKARRAIIADDPIGTLDTAIGRFEKRREQIKEHIVSARAARKRHTASIEDFKSKRDNNISLANVAGSQALAQVYLTQVGRWDKAIEDAEPIKNILAQAEEKMKQAAEVVDVTLIDLKGQRETFSVTLDAMKAGQSAVKKMTSFFSKNDDLDMINLSIEEIEKQTTEAEANIDQFFDDINPMIQANDLKKRAEAEAAMKKFGKFLNGGSKALPEGGSTGTPVLDAEPVTEKVKR